MKKKKKITMKDFNDFNIYIIKKHPNLSKNINEIYKDTVAFKKALQKFNEFKKGGIGKIALEMIKLKK